MYWYTGIYTSRFIYLVDFNLDSMLLGVCTGIQVYTSRFIYLVNSNLDSTSRFMYHVYPNLELLQGVYTGIKVNIQYI